MILLAIVLGVAIADDVTLTAVVAAPSDPPPPEALPPEAWTPAEVPADPSAAGIATCACSCEAPTAVYLRSLEPAPTLTPRRSP